MSFDSNPRCLIRNCSFNCCNINGTCPLSPSSCYYAYNSYYCYNNCTSQYYYSTSTCSSTCSNESSLNQGLIYGCIFGGFFFVLIITSLILYKCNQKSNKVNANEEIQEQNQSSNLDDNSLSTINDGELHSVANKKKQSNSNRLENKTGQNKKIQSKRIEKKKAENKTKEEIIKQIKPTYGKAISLQRKAMIPDFSF